MATEKMGRPTDSIKDFMLRTRLDQKTLTMLDSISKQENLSRSEVVRKGIEIQYTSINK